MNVTFYFAFVWLVDTSYTSERERERERECVCVCVLIPLGRGINGEEANEEEGVANGEGEEIHYPPL